MSKFGKSKGPGDKKNKRVKVREALKCRFCREKAESIDYKDINLLQKMVSSQGKHFARKRTGNCAKHQRMSRTALKHARFIGLMPFCG
ncbi:MAG: 30S ribosomal protein S18 [Planctomycetes bacterium]|nr:30S ribosomal protein S18 [Planctomycetota bacterium]